jgi:hypothetical protein
MFCPECRKYWDAPQNAEDAKVPKRPAKRTRCTVCGALLAQDRLIAEFPIAPEKQQAERGARERRLTVAEILRETAGPSPVDSFKAASAAEQTADVRHDWRGFKAAMEGEIEADWQGSNSPTIPPGFGCPKRGRPPLALILDVAMLSGILLLIVAVLVHTVIGFQKRADGIAGTSPSPHDAALGMPAASADSLTSALALPPSIGGWLRLDKPAAIATVSESGTVFAASYRRGSESVRVWIQQTGSPSQASATLVQMTHKCQSVSASGGVTQISSKRSDFRSHAGVVFDAGSSAGAIDDYSAVSATPGIAIFPHTRSWRQGSKVITVASDSARNRDDFANTFSVR